VAITNIIQCLGVMTALYFSTAPSAYAVAVPADWSPVERDGLAALFDDDLNRHQSDSTYLMGLAVSQRNFVEAGFAWHLIRFVNMDKPIGPLWVVPHDDENSAFEAAIAAVKEYGGAFIAVNSGDGSNRMQFGNGTCGSRTEIISECDPNRNFSIATPLYTNAFLDALSAGEPIIALHTNTPGHGGDKGSITILNASAAAQGIIQPRFDGHFGAAGPQILQNYDSYAIMPYILPEMAPEAMACGHALVEEGVHVWHERVEQSDDSLSNFIALEKPDIAYVNMESRRETDLGLAAERHQLMIAAYLKHCAALWNQPAP
jgi:hypothetical protein